MNMSMNMSISKERNSKNVCIKNDCEFSRCVCLPEWTEMGQIIEMENQNRPRYLCRLYKDMEAFNGYRKCFFSENYRAKFGQMKILTHEM